MTQKRTLLKFLWEVAYNPESLSEFELDLKNSPRARLYNFLDWGLNEQDKKQILTFMGSDLPTDSVNITGGKTSFANEMVKSIFHVSVGDEGVSVMFTGWGVSWGQMEWDEKIQIVEPYEKVVIEYKSIMTLDRSTPIK